MSEMTLWGFDTSTYVRTVKMVLAEKGFTQFEQVPLNVLQANRRRRTSRATPLRQGPGSRPRRNAHLGDLRDRALPQRRAARTVVVPATPKDRARMDMIVGMVDSYGYGALIGGVAAYHLFPDFVGGKNDATRKGGLENGRKVIELAMKTKGSSPFIAGELSLADLYLAPIMFYVSLTPDKDAVFDVDGFAEWWANMEALPSFKSTQPKLS